MQVEQEEQEALTEEARDWCMTPFVWDGGKIGIDAELSFVSPTVLSRLQHSQYTTGALSKSGAPVSGSGDMAGGKVTAASQQQPVLPVVPPRRRR